ncbi:GNAT family N-acetyltransferase [Alkalihalobacillus pseudalcaliphilus]|uniref:GNAT family N-acetyltransferase n=1 Tax=Alkalihalobacillus pseudalcaliphilus TaxID=79884 RepID=UPI00064DF405|nr:GNAT family N-acetyltransferase [Alkalihalobacillus pseudalcaliphilus]KMK75502.1 hypothetical protein AB990_09380 [Alkalihalobacillus pseudalcaliphilus]
MLFTIEYLKKEDEKSLFDFEVQNRSFFETMIPSRGEAFYQVSEFQQRHQLLLEEQERGESLFYLIKDQKKRIIGRMNVTDIKTSEAELGYRLGQEVVGKGIATQALAKLINELSTNQLVTKLKAKTTSNHFASQKVLEKNGFIKVEESADSFKFLGEDVYFVHYVWEGESNQHEDSKGNI